MRSLTLLALVSLAFAPVAQAADHFDRDSIAWQSWASAEAKIYPWPSGAAETDDDESKYPVGGGRGTSTFTGESGAVAGLVQRSDTYGPPLDLSYVSATAKTFAKHDYTDGSWVMAYVKYAIYAGCELDNLDYQKAEAIAAGASYMKQVLKADFDTETTWHEVKFTIRNSMTHNPSYDSRRTPPFASFDGYVVGYIDAYNYLYSTWKTTLGTNNDKNGWQHDYSYRVQGGPSYIYSGYTLTGQLEDDDMDFDFDRICYVKLKHNETQSIYVYINDADPHLYNGSWSEYRDDVDAVAGYEYYDDTDCTMKGQITMNQIIDTGVAF